MENDINTGNLKNMLESKNVKPSFQRISVLRYIMQNMNHPSAETIYKNLVDEIPTLSKTTIYNTLNLLTKNNIITSLSITDTEIRYDYQEKNHAHFLCLYCKQIFDVENSEASNIKMINGHQIQQVQIHYKGICLDCSTKQKKHH